VAVLPATAAGGGWAANAEGSIVLPASAGSGWQ
jgi:hypothetical protein